MKPISKASIRFPWLVALLAVASIAANSQTAARFVGSVTAITGTSLTVKTDAGEQRQFDVPSEAVLKRIAPGEKDLTKAATIAFTDLAVGDRVLVKLDPASPTPQAAQIIAVKAEDLAQKQQKDREDWQRRGVAGLVKSVDPASGAITLTTGAGATAKSVTVHTTKASVLKRYASGSVRYDEAKPAPIDAIQPGDQLRARGEKTADGSEIAADEVISGSFRNIAGTIASLDAATSTLVVKDLATKKQITIHLSPEAQMRRLPDRMAQMLAMRLKGGTPGAGGGPADLVGGPPPASASGGPPSAVPRPAHPAADNIAGMALPAAPAVNGPARTAEAIRSRCSTAPPPSNLPTCRKGKRSCSSPPRAPETSPPSPCWPASNRCSKLRQPARICSPTGAWAPGAAAKEQPQPPSFYSRPDC